jgi:adenylate kinase family enzyme
MSNKDTLCEVFKRARRIAVIGNAGSGKSTVARKIQTVCGLPLHHLDTYFWKSNWTHPNRDEYKIVHDALCDQPEWIIEGTNLSLWEHRKNRAEIIIILKIPRFLCIRRILKRTWMYYGKQGPGSAHGCNERFNWRFLKFLGWVWEFESKYLVKITELVESYQQTKKIYVLSSQHEIDTFLDELAGC